MKVFCASALAAVTVATAPPRIELDLQGATGAFKLASSIYRAHDIAAYKQPDGSSVQSRQDWTEKCAANLDCKNSDPTGRKVCTDACPFPVANAYDHQDGTAVDVTTRIFLVDKDGTTQTGAALSSASDVDFTQRSTLLFKYDAHDQAGNRAEQVVFALILDDQEAPRISMCNGVAETVEAASDWQLCSTTTWLDNIDPKATMTLEYTTAMVSSAVGPHEATFVPCTSGDHACAAASLATTRTGRFLVTMTVSDNAGSYGRNQQDNQAVARKAVLIKDTMDPWINVQGADPTYVQCTRTPANTVIEASDPTYNASTAATVGHYRDRGALATDNLDTALRPSHEFWARPCWADRTAGSSKEFCAAAATAKLLSQAQAVQGEAQTEIAIDVRSMAMDTDNSGNYTITYNHADEAGNDAQSQTRQVRVRDTIAPAGALIGNSHQTYRHEQSNSELHNSTDNLVTHHSSVQAAGLDQGVNATDLCDPGIPHTGFICNEDSAKNRNGAYTSDAGATDGTYAVTDAAADTAFSDASYTNRFKPECKLEWSRTDFSLDGYTEGGSISSAPLGTYIRTYTVQDHVGNQNHWTRTFDIIDLEAPIIKIMGQPEETYQASRDLEYTDQGATCADYVDGELSHAVEVSGQVVNYRVPGEYTIHYNCQDLSGNTATQVNRTVYIEDTTCPTITLVGQPFTYVEAGFPYVDEGATATDTLDGDITALITTDGDQVNVANAFYARRSCHDIKQSWEAANTAESGIDGHAATSLECGNYWITTQNPTSQAFQRTEVWCDFADGRSNTFYFANVEPSGMVDAIGGAEPAQCTDVGMVRYQSRPTGTTCPTATATDLSYKKVMQHLGLVNGGASGECDFAQPTYETREDYGMLVTTAGVQDSAVTCHDPNNAVNAYDGVTQTSDTLHSKISGFNNEKTVDNQNRGVISSENNRAETGKYLIKFHVSDKAGNPECQTRVRTVVVRDTLAPVISLHLKQSTGTHMLIHTSAANDVGIGGQKNPAGWHGTVGSEYSPGDSATDPSGGNPYLKDFGASETFPSMMAEEAATSSTNGWIVGAAASAVTGLALLGYSQRKSTVTTVPV
jgi:hypothetical protein